MLLQIYRRADIQRKIASHIVVLGRIAVTYQLKRTCVTVLCLLLRDDDGTLLSSNEVLTSQPEKGGDRARQHGVSPKLCVRLTHWDFSSVVGQFVDVCVWRIEPAQGQHDGTRYGQSC